MKVLLKFVVLGAWALFILALWRNSQLPVSRVAAWSSPSLGMLSISRKVTDSRPLRPMVPLPESATWPTLLIVLPLTGH